MYREVKLDFTPEMEVLYVLFERCHNKNRKISLKQHTTYFNFRSKIQLTLMFLSEYYCDTYRFDLWLI